MEFHVTIKGDDSSEARSSVEQIAEGVRSAMRQTAGDAAAQIKGKLTDDITKAGKFGGDWVEAIKAEVSDGGDTVILNAGYEPGGPPVTYWGVFQFGATITAKGPKGLLTWPNKSGFAVGGTTPAFISKHSVTIPKKFHIIEIIDEVAQQTLSEFAQKLTGS